MEVSILNDAPAVPDIRIKELFLLFQGFNCQVRHQREKKE
jgi:hypothetical protein